MQWLVQVHYNRYINCSLQMSIMWWNNLSTTAKVMYEKVLVWKLSMVCKFSEFVGVASYQKNVNGGAVDGSWSILCVRLCNSHVLYCTVQPGIIIIVLSLKCFWITLFSIYSSHLWTSGRLYSKCFFVCSPKKIVEYGKIGGKNVNCSGNFFVWFGQVYFIWI